MPLFRWVRDLESPRSPGTYEVRHRVVRVTQDNIAAAEQYLRRYPSGDAIFFAERQRSDVYKLGAIMRTDRDRRISDRSSHSGWRRSRHSVTSADGRLADRP